MRHSFFLNPDFEFAVFYLGILAMSYLSAAVLYLTVEQPVANLEGISYRKKHLIKLEVCAGVTPVI